MACGRCCFHGPNHVQLYDEDLVTLGASRVAGLTAPSSQAARPDEPPGTLFMKTAEGHCIALDATPGRYFCTIYEDRPLRCRVYEPGSASCLAARARPTQSFQ